MQQRNLVQRGTSSWGILHQGRGFDEKIERVWFFFLCLGGVFFLGCKFFGVFFFRVFFLLGGAGVVFFFWGGFLWGGSPFEDRGCAARKESQGDPPGEWPGERKGRMPLRGTNSIDPWGPLRQEERGGDVDFEIQRASNLDFLCQNQVLSLKKWADARSGAKRPYIPRKEVFDYKGRENRVVLGVLKGRHVGGVRTHAGKVSRSHNGKKNKNDL